MTIISAVSRICSAALLLSLVSCGDDGGNTPAGDTELTVGVPHSGSLPARGRHTFAAPVSPSMAYAVALTGLTAPVHLQVFDDDPTVSDQAACLIDYPQPPGGGSREDCVLIASGSTLYLVVDGAASDTVSSYTITVGATSSRDLAVGVPVAGTASRAAAAFYQASVVPGTAYVASLTGLTDPSVNLYVASAGADAVLLNAVPSPRDLTFVAAAANVYLLVDGTPLSTPSASFVVTLTPAPVVIHPVEGTDGSVPQGVPTVGFVEPGGTSDYQTMGMDPGNHMISIFGVTDAVGLHVIDPALGIEGHCTLVSTNVRECPVGGTAVTFNVKPGPGNQDGAGYVILVW